MAVYGDNTGGEKVDISFMILLHELPVGDSRRNTPMKQLEVHCRNKQQKNWRNVKSWKIGTATYNQLGEVWTTYSEFAIL